MKKVLLFMIAIILLFTFVACDEELIEEDNELVDKEVNVVDKEVNEDKTEEQLRIDENNAVILPKLEELEATIVEIETFVNSNDLSEEYQSGIDHLREELDLVTKNHKTIIDMGGYLNGTEDFKIAVESATKKNKELLFLMEEDFNSILIEKELIDKLNQLVDLVNEVKINAQENGWGKNEILLSELDDAHTFMDELKAEIDSLDYFDDAYRNEKVLIIDGVLSLLQEYLDIVLEPCTE